MPSTEIILTDNVPGLGAEADIVKVRRGYARNYLLPHGKAHEVTPASLRQLENLKKKRAEREARELNEAEELARRLAEYRRAKEAAAGRLPARRALRVRLREAARAQEGDAGAQGERAARHLRDLSRGGEGSGRGGLRPGRRHLPRPRSAGSNYHAVHF